MVGALRKEEGAISSGVRTEHFIPTHTHEAPETVNVPHYWGQQETRKVTSTCPILVLRLRGGNSLKDTIDLWPR